MGGCSSLPYDAEIEYMEGTGTQWIDTGIYFDTTKHGCEIDAILINDKYGTVTLCGIWEGSWDNNHLGSIINGNFNRAYFFCPLENFRGGRVGLALAQPNDRNKVGFINHGLSNGEITVTRTVNTISDSIVMTNPYIGVSAHTFPIFGVKTSNYGTIGQIAHLKLYGFKMFDLNTVILDLIPVRIGTTGYMYDKVSDQFFGNAGTGSFILGPDKT
jgi:hypothetical protein